MYYKTDYTSSIGDIRIVSDEEHILGLWFYHQKYFCDSIQGEILETEEIQVLKDCRAWLDEYFKENNPSIESLSLKPIGGEFRQVVWKILMEIPYGTTMTYGEIAQEAAKRLGKERMSAQAVGGAVGHNPVSIIIPCHRAVGSNGSLTGYAGGLDKKIALLNHEKVDMKNLFVPKKGTAL